MSKKHTTQSTLSLPSLPPPPRKVWKFVPAPDRSEGQPLRWTALPRLDPSACQQRQYQVIQYAHSGKWWGWGGAGGVTQNSERLRHWRIPAMQGLSETLDFPVGQGSFNKTGTTCTNNHQLPLRGYAQKPDLSCFHRPSLPGRQPINRHEYTPSIARGFGLDADAPTTVCSSTYRSSRIIIQLVAVGGVLSMAYSGTAPARSRYYCTCQKAV